MTQIVLSTEQVLGIASQIENDNRELNELLKTSKSTVDSLSSYWKGTASSATQDAYNSFAQSYFQKYYEILDQYVRFLRNNVVINYENTEKADIQLADAFK